MTANGTVGAVPAPGTPEPARHTSEPASGGPTALRIMLGGRLRRLREERGVSRERAADAIRATHSKISRLELGRSAFKQRDLVDLLDLYGVTDEKEREAMLALARRASQPGWWHRYGEVMPDWLELYIGLEQAASLVRSFEVQFVHGLMQTEEYARAVIQVGNAGASANEIEQRLALRMKRQALLTEPDRLTLWAVLDEAALHRPLGGRAVMRRQLEYLLELSDLTNVTLQVVPFSVGAHPGAGGPFTILRFPHNDLPDVVYLEQISSALYLDKPADVGGYMQIMSQLCVLAPDGTQTRKLLRDLLRAL